VGATSWRYYAAHQPLLKRACVSGTLRQAFGTDAPTHEEVERHWADVAERLGRWEACYLVVYRGGEPHEYAFIGCSAD
jgi:hypothetical protein